MKNEFVQFALDQESARTIDEQGFLHVEINNISKATVNPYRGDEIPNYVELQLDPYKIYYILRPAEELEKSISTFNNLPLLDKHIEVSAFDLEDPEVKKHVVGSTGEIATFNAPYLQNSLVIWTANAIEGIMQKTQTQLSCAYRYDIDMTPGIYEGNKYDGIMRNIRGNHVALVSEGRVGPDVVVKDEKSIKSKTIKDSFKIALSRKNINDDMNEMSNTTYEQAEMAAKYADRLATLKPTTQNIQIAALLYQEAAIEHARFGFIKQSLYHEAQYEKWCNVLSNLGVDSPNIINDIEKREDINAKSGINKYGNVKFADPKNKKYPIDTPKHVKAAISYWGKTENQNKYSKEDQLIITNNIKQAAKKFNIGNFADK